MPGSQTSEFGDVYSAYAAGCLDPAFALMVETQAALRPDVARALARADTIAGVFLETEEAAALSDTALDRALAAIERSFPEDDRQIDAARKAGSAIGEMLDLPEPLREIALETVQDSGWKALGTGVKRLKLGMDSAAEVELYRIEPNSRVPRHTHSGNEFTLVVAGGFTDETGQYGPGDITIKGPDDVHQPTGDADGVCFALSVRDGGLRFTGMLGVVQKLLRQ